MVTGYLFFVIIIVSAVLIKHHYEYLCRPAESISARERLIFLRYKQAMTNWLILVFGISLFFALNKPIEFVTVPQILIIGTWIFFYTYFLILAPWLLYRFLK